MRLRLEEENEWSLQYQISGWSLLRRQLWSTESVREEWCKVFLGGCLDVCTALGLQIWSLGLAVSSEPGNLLEMLILDPHPRPTESKLRVGPRVLCFNKSLRRFWWTPSLRNHRQLALGPTGNVSGLLHPKQIQKSTDARVSYKMM
jgi:hypothetical protein